MKRLIRVLPFVLCLCFIVSVFAVPAYASTSDVDPADYVTSITVVDGVKTVNYEFVGVEPYVSAWDSSEHDIIVGSTYWELGQGAKQFALTLCPIGLHVAEGADCDRNRILVSDIIPGCPIDISFSVGVTYGVYGVSDGFEYYNGYTAGFYTYDKNGKYLDTVSLRVVNSVTSNGRDVFGHVYEISGTIPLNAYAILPWFKLDSWLGDYDPDLRIEVNITPGVLKLSTAVDSIVEQSHQMTVIQNKLDDIGGKLDDISGALNGDANVDAGVSDFSGANDALSNAMQSAGVVMDAGSDSVSDIANSSVMAGTLSSLGSGLAVAFSDEFKVNLCGMSFNPFTLWVTVIGGFSLIALMVAYIFRKRGGS